VSGVKSLLLREKKRALKGKAKGRKTGKRKNPQTPKKKNYLHLGRDSGERVSKKRDESNGGEKGGRRKSNNTKGGREWERKLLENVGGRERDSEKNVRGGMSRKDGGDAGRGRK